MASKAARRATRVVGGSVSSTTSSPAQSSQFTIGKLDAGIAVLLGDESSHLIEFPSLLLPPGCQPGSIVSISCTRDQEAERTRLDEFWQLQSDILTEFGEKIPSPPALRLRNVTQTSVTLEWDRLDLAQAKLLGLTIWRNGQRVASIPNPQNNTSTKLSGLDLDHDYVFHLVLKTSAGTFSSNQLKVRTHKITDTSGICVCFGTISPPAALEEAKEALESMGAKYSEKIQIDTTHFVCTSPGTGLPAVQYQRALQLSIPTVLPSWVLACQREKRMVQIAAHYLGSAQPAPQPQPQTKQASVAPQSPPKASGSGSMASKTAASQTSTEAPASLDQSASRADDSGAATAESPMSRPAVADPEAPNEVSEVVAEVDDAVFNNVDSSADLDPPGETVASPRGAAFSEVADEGEDERVVSPPIMSPKLETASQIDVGHLEEIALNEG